MGFMAVTIREAGQEDIPAINPLMNYYIEHTPVLFDYCPWTLQQRQSWFARYDQQRFHMLVAVSAEHGHLLGMTCNSPFMDKAAYAVSSESSIYLSPWYAVFQKGLGRNLYQALLDRLAESAIHRLYARIALPNRHSVKLHEHFGFRQCGLLHEAGYKFSRYYSVALYEKALNKNAV